MKFKVHCDYNLGFNTDYPHTFHIHAYNEEQFLKTLLDILKNACIIPCEFDSIEQMLENNILTYKWIKK